MKKRNTYEEYWRERLDYNFKQEFNIYKCLCGKMRWKKQLSKITDEKNFTSYLSWKRNIKVRCECLSIEELIEFLRYLNLHKREEKISDTLNINFFLSFYVALLAGVFVPAILKIDWVAVGTVLIDCVKLLFVAQSNLDRIIIMVAFVMLTLLLLSLLIGVTFMFMAPLFLVIKDIFRAELIAGFYVDYMEIIKEKIREKECKMC